jgi:hypothetical protein
VYFGTIIWLLIALLLYNSPMMSQIWRKRVNEEYYHVTEHVYRCAFDDFYIYSTRQHLFYLFSLI